MALLPMVPETVREIASDLAWGHGSLAHVVDAGGYAISSPVDFRGSKGCPLILTAVKGVS